MNELTKIETSSPYFSIVIPAYNEEEHIGSCLHSVFNSDYDSAQYEVIVVDNGSQDNTYDIAINSGLARVFRLPEGNVGAVRNYGAKKAQGEMLVFIDADCLLDKGWLNRAEELIRNKPKCAYGGGAKLPSNATWVETSWLLEINGQPTLPKHLIGASTVLSRKSFFQIDGFNELISSGEDTDLHNRLKDSNVPIVIDHTLDITHLGNAKTLFKFMKRQMWHSENYFENLEKSIKDPVFIISILFMTFPFFTIFQKIILNSQVPLIILITTWINIPTILSIKRLIRSKYTRLNINKAIKIYLLDLTYLTGRCIGIVRSIFH